jgi:glycosyltransferase involved in cell wall biosynthesis
MHSPYLSVIIPTYNRAEKLDRCLAALRSQDLATESFEVLVVDDGSSDSTPELLKKWAGEWSSLKVLSQKNSGQGVARNKALKQARGQVILFIGDDIYAGKNFLKAHLQFHQDSPQLEAAALGLTEWEEPVTPFMHWLTHGGHQFAYCKLTAHEEASFWFFYTSNISLKKDFLGARPFDPTFKAYGWEDIELGYRLSKKNLQLMYIPEACATHDHFMEEASLKDRMQKIGRSAVKFQKHHKDLHVLPSGLKKLTFLLIGSAPSIAGLFLLKSFIPSIFSRYYWYALMKRYFLQGIRGI